MKIAFFSDVHANLPALESCLKSIENEKPDAIYCLGDLVGYNVWPNEVINVIRKRGIPTIAGNYDQGIGQHSKECGCAYRSEAEKEMGKISIAYTNSIIQSDERMYLASLPAHIKIEFRSQHNTFNLVLVHGSPRKINEYLFEDREEKSLIRIMEQAAADILCFGHTHKPYHRILKTQREQILHYRHAINIGSVGKPKDNNPKGCYVLLHIDLNRPLVKEDAIKVDFIRFDYNIEKAAKAIEQSPLPNQFATMLRQGI